MPEPSLDAQRVLVASLADPTRYGPHCRGVRVIETHISYVLLTGTFAYKIKKAVDLGFLDFRTLSARRFFCQEEIRLNRRLAPSIYLDVVTIGGTPQNPQFDAPGAPLEYAVRMREFPQHALLPAVMARGALTPDHIAALGERIAAFHDASRRALPHTRFGSPADVLELALDNFSQLAGLIESAPLAAALSRLEAWTRHEHARLSPLLDRRRHRGSVRECHGDLHLGNVALIDDVATPFDCIEFNERMRWSDVISDAAFLVMDLTVHGRADFANRFLNRYLGKSGDYDGLGLLRFFVVYRAVVRAKVAVLRSRQTPAGTERAAAMAAAIRFVRIAAESAREGRPAILITHGLSGSGKTTVASRCASAWGAIHLRADVERKRLFGLDPLARTGATIATGIYSPVATRQTYDRLAALARTVVEHGYPAIVDASFLSRWQRERFRGLADAAGVPFVVLDCVAPLNVMLERVASRAARADDASEANRDVIVHQMETAEPLDAEERVFAVQCDTGALPSGAILSGVLEGVGQRLRLRMPRPHL